ncbi:unnamed protein product, partial [Mesorhabditis belari]|uniref:DUF7808 domain-containing protein n=1 Tax=Mesorhabditis belari TaxID=2138241 RepID=A0AAF3FML7_9BILA
MQIIDKRMEKRRETTCEERIEKSLPETPLIHDCEISCPGADRDSVISKTPSNNHKCIRYYSYDTLQIGNKWSIWRSGVCANQTITLEVHCGFPEKVPARLSN